VLASPDSIIQTVNPTSWEHSIFGLFWRCWRNG